MSSKKARTTEPGRHTQNGTEYQQFRLPSAVNPTSQPQCGLRAPMGAANDVGKELASSMCDGPYPWAYARLRRPQCTHDLFSTCLQQIEQAVVHARFGQDELARSSECYVRVLLLDALADPSRLPEEHLLKKFLVDMFAEAFGSRETVSILMMQTALAADTAALALDEIMRAA